MKKITILLTTICSSFIFAVNNPMSYHILLRDCDTMKYNGEYYLVGNHLKSDTLISRDLRNWGWRTHIFSYNNSWHTPSDPNDPDNDIGAGHLTSYNGNFHYYTQLDAVNGITHATNNISPTEDYFEGIDSPFAQWIDPETFRDDDGAFYFYSAQIGGGQEYITSRTMSDLFTFSGSYSTRITPSISNINEAPKVFKYRDRYYMLYNIYGTGDDNYQIKCVEANGPVAFANSGKYSDPTVGRTVFDTDREIVRIGQPWVVDGPNGFERWIGYFAYVRIISTDTIIEQGQYIDRLYFLGDDLKADAPTHRDSSGYHPPPAMPEYLGLFNKANGELPPELTYGGGTWNIVDRELRQTDPSDFKYVIINTNRADNFLVEANIKFLNGTSTNAGIVLFQDGDDWLRVGLDENAGRWFYERLSDGNYDNANFVLPAGFNFQAYHKIQLQKNGNTVYIKIDDIPAPSLSSIVVNFDGGAQAELFTFGAQAAFDGVAYSVGWDEWNNSIQYWGGTKSGIPQLGIWNYGSTGLNQTETNGSGYIFKGDLMSEYEIDVRCSVIDNNSNSGRRIGIFPVAIDGANYMTAQIDPATTELVVGCVTNDIYFAYPNTPITYNPTPGSWNIRAAKLKDKVIIFVNGKELLTVNIAYPAAQVGLITENQNGNFSSVLVYKTKNKSLPEPWLQSDIGSVKYPGRADFTENFITVNGGGNDFWNTSDSGHFVYQEINSDKEIIAKVEMLDPSWYWAKAALMIRETMASDSKMAHICLTKMDANNTNGAQFISRSNTGDSTPVEGKYTYRMFPSYLKLIRIGDAFDGYWSSDGETWERVGNATISMNQTCYIGLGVTANNNDRFSGAVFSDVTINNIPEPAFFGLIALIVLAFQTTNNKKQQQTS